MITNNLSSTYNTHDVHIQFTAPNHNNNVEIEKQEEFRSFKILFHDSS